MEIFPANKVIRLRRSLTIIDSALLYTWRKSIITRAPQLKAWMCSQHPLDGRSEGSEDGDGGGVPGDC